MDIKKIDLNMATNYLSVDKLNWIQVNDNNFVLKGGLFLKKTNLFIDCQKQLKLDLI